MLSDKRSDFIRLWTLFCSTVLALVLNGLPIPSASAGPLQTRLEQFPDWRSPPMLQTAKDDLYYPEWMSGHWEITSTLVDLAAPLAPTIVTPGFEDSQKLLQKPVTFLVRFGPAPAIAQPIIPSSPFPVGTISSSNATPQIVADRIYNSMSLATALLGKDIVRAIEIDPRSPNRQVAFFQNGQQLITQISKRGVETPSPSAFVSSELYQQFFSNDAQIYLNQVENTIAYRLKSIDPPSIEAEQVTAIYLSPQDPDYFKAKTHPVTLYRYRLQFEALR
jgi:hypothetical protein